MSFKTQDWERNLRERMQALREAKGWTQTDLAKRLKADFGLPFYQQTIQRIEAGERPVRLNEAYAFAEVFDVDLPSLTDDEGGVGSVRLALDVALSRLYEAAQEVFLFVNEHWAKVDEAHQEVENAWIEYESAQRDLGLEPDGDLGAMVRRFTTRYSRAADVIIVLSELGDM